MYKNNLISHYLWFLFNASPTLFLSLSNLAEYLVINTSPKIHNGPLKIK